MGLLPARYGRRPPLAVQGCTSGAHGGRLRPIRVGLARSRRRLGAERRRQDSLYDELDRYLASADFKRVMNRIAKYLRYDLQGTDSRKTPRFKRYVRRRIRKALDRLTDQETDFSSMTPEQLHELRKRGRKTRYAAETGAVLFGKHGRDTLRAIKTVVDTLGRIHDCDVFAARIERRRSQGFEKLKKAIREERRKELRELAGKWRRMLKCRSAW